MLLDFIGECQAKNSAAFSIIDSAKIKILKHRANLSRFFACRYGEQEHMIVFFKEAFLRTCFSRGDSDVQGGPSPDDIR
jgi:hypothetical protein